MSPESDALCLLGDYMAWQGKGCTEAGARELRIVHKLMREGAMLAAQLARHLHELFPKDPTLPHLVETLTAQARAIAPTDAAAEEAGAAADGDNAGGDEGDAGRGPGDTGAVAAAVAAASIAPPNSRRALVLRRALAAASPDRIARLGSLCDAPSERQLITDAASTDLKPALLRRAYLASGHGSGQLLWLSVHSTIVKNMKPRPGYVAFLEVEADGKRPHLCRATAIDPSWLVESAAPLVTLGPPELSLPPRYDAPTDAPLCWRIPTYLPTNAPTSWTLPAVPRPPPFDGPSWLRPALFGRALCSGQVLPPLSRLAEEFEGRTKGLASEALIDRAALALRSALERRKVSSRASLLAVWASEPTWLQRELAALLDGPRRATLVEMWPALLESAEEGGTSGKTAAQGAKSKKRRRAP